MSVRPKDGVEEVDDSKVYNELRFELTRLATAIVGPSDAEDVVSTVVAKTLRRRGGLASLGDPRLYLIKGVINEGRSVLRRRNRWSVTEQIPEVAVPADSRADEDVLRVVMALPSRQRVAVFLVYWEGYTPTSAAELMGCRPATVRRYLHLARQKLEVQLNERS